MNDKLYACCDQLSDEQLSQGRGAFFGSVLATLNHILVGDLIWLGRFAQNPAGVALLEGLSGLPVPSRLDQLLYEDFAALGKVRAELDKQLVSFVETLDDQQLAADIFYSNTKGEKHCQRLSYLLLHLFNHQTHHRGQVTTMLSQLDLDVGMTDLLFALPASKL